MKTLTLAAAALAATIALAPAALAQTPPPPEIGGAAPVGPDTKRLRFAYGPIVVTPGSNLNLAGPVTIERPAYEGFITRFRPDLVRADGTPPPVDLIHLHHGIWINLSRRDMTAPDAPGDRVAAAGEEKTILTYPPGYGYRLRPSDVLGLNYMLHNQTPVTETVWVTWEIDYVAADSPTGRAMKDARVLWMDVRNGRIYPVYDVRRGSGGDGRFTYPDEARNPYGDGPRLNEFTVPEDGALIWSAGHLHPGGLYTDLELQRGGSGPPELLFRSDAVYFNNRPPVSWDMAMTETPPGWKIGLRAGDKLRMSATYEAELASWYEAMGIHVALFAPGDTGPEHASATRGEPTHGPLPENANFGGAETGLPDPRTLPSSQTLERQIGIAGFNFLPGTVGLAGGLGNPPSVDKGDEVIWQNADAGGQVWHTVTSCKAPCNRSTGIGYPLADGEVAFDSGELGYGPSASQAAANRHTFSLDTDDLDPGTYTYFCRIHPFMRGAFRVR